MIPKFALHGAGQKGHDEVAGLKDDKGQPADIDDMILAMEELFDRLARREVGMPRTWREHFRDVASCSPRSATSRASRAMSSRTT